MCIIIIIIIIAFKGTYNITGIIYFSTSTTLTLVLKHLFW